MKNRLLIKSAIAAQSHGIFSPQVVDEEGEVITPRTKIQNAFIPGRDSVYSVNLESRTITITDGGKISTIPINDADYAYREK